MSERAQPLEPAVRKPATSWSSDKMDARVRVENLTDAAEICREVSDILAGQNSRASVRRPGPRTPRADFGSRRSCGFDRIGPSASRWSRRDEIDHAAINRENAVDEILRAASDADVGRRQALVSRTWRGDECRRRRRPAGPTICRPVCATMITWRAVGSDGRKAQAFGQIDDRQDGAAQIDDAAHESRRAREAPSPASSRGFRAPT